MKLDRRQFFLLTAGLAAGCQTPPDGDRPTAGNGHWVAAGPTADYAAPGIYDRFRSRGFFLVRREGKLFALSSVCTHRQCRLEAELDGTFSCPCHGSSFDAEGHVTAGPAQRDLPVCPLTVDEQGQVRVKVP